MTMDVKEYASIGSVILAIIRYFYPRNASKYDLSLVKEREINFDKKDYVPFSKLQLSYNGNQPIDNFTLFSFSIRNTGNVDITEEMLREDVVIRFPDNCIVLESKLGKGSKESKPRIHFKSNKLYIKWDLLKPQEQILINSLISQNSIMNPTESEKSDSIVNSLSIEQRIYGINGIGKFLSSEVETIEKTKSDYKIQGFLNLFIGVLFFINIPIINHWLVNTFSDCSYNNFEWNIFEIIGTVIFVPISIFEFFIGLVELQSAKKFRQSLS